MKRQHNSGGARRFSLSKWAVLGILLFAVLLFCVLRLTKYGQSSRSRQETNEQLSRLHSGQTDVPSPVITIPSPAPETQAPEPEQTAVAAAPSGGMVTPSAPAATAVPTRPAYYQLGNSAYPILSEMETLYSRNGDLVAWVSIPGVVDLPVVYRNNTYYLKRDFYGKSNSGGTLFLDEMHPFLPDTQHLVVHGHNMKDGTMFAHLTHYQQPGYAEAHREISWNTLYRKEIYRIYAVSLVATDLRSPRYVNYLGTARFSDETQLQAYLGKLKQTALYWDGDQVNLNDALLTLSTCLEDDRILISARRVSP